MILTELDILDAFFCYISSSELQKMISGKLYRMPRPQNSKKEDIVLSVLATGNGQIQPFVLNVNVYVPDIKRGNEFILNEQRIAPLMRMASQVLAHGKMTHVVNGKEYDFLFDMESQKIYEVNGVDYHAINHRINVKVCTE